MCGPAASAMVRDISENFCLSLRVDVGRTGFFQIVGHRVPAELQEDVLDSLKSFFSLPLAEKEKVHKGEIAPSPNAAAAKSSLRIR